MSVWDRPPPEIVYSFRQGDTGCAVGSLQKTLAQLGAPVVVDGSFGSETRIALIRYQRNRGLEPDGICGPATQRRIADGWLRDAEQRYPMPAKLLEGIVIGESGGYLGAVNWSVAGGCDCGLAQRRVYGPPWDPAAVERAFDSRYQLRLAARTIKDRHDAFITRAGVRAAPAGYRDEFAWRLAVLNHNWQWGAQRVADGYELSERVADWVPEGTRFDDGAPVVTYRDWAQFYSLGSRLHRHKGKMVQAAFGLPAV